MINWVDRIKRLLKVKNRAGELELPQYLNFTRNQIKKFFNSNFTNYEQTKEDLLYGTSVPFFYYQTIAGILVNYHRIKVNSDSIFK